MTEQTVWMLVLVLSFVSAFKKEMKNGSLNVLWLTEVGIAMYLVLFEQRARYVYIFAPVFCVLASVGLDTAVGLAKAQMSRKKSAA